jgi:hypothetical protein
MQRFVSLPVLGKLRLSGPVSTSAVAVCDINRDGVLEAVVGGADGRLVAVLLGNSVSTVAHP